MSSLTTQDQVLLVLLARASGHPNEMSGKEAEVDARVQGQGDNVNGALHGVYVITDRLSCT